MKVSATRLALCLCCLAFCVFAWVPTVAACNIPVFRYALERWQPDACQFIVFRNQNLSEEDAKILKSLKSQSQSNGGYANIKVIEVDIRSSKSEDLLELWGKLKAPANQNTPYVVIRTKLGGDRLVNVWHGPLRSASATRIADSPARQKLAKRLVAGDSVVWLLVKSNNEKRNTAAKLLLQEQFLKLGKTVQIPEGVGTPGSELYSDVPLLIRFSIIEIDPADTKEQFFAQQFTGFQKKAYMSGAPLLVPVFGRGRALEVIPLKQVDGPLVSDLTAFLCGACSCQVKDMNPGFDLLMTVNWEKSLFGNGEAPPTSGAVRPNQKNRAPELIPIPPGRNRSR